MGECYGVIKGETRSLDCSSLAQASLTSGFILKVSEAAVIVGTRNLGCLGGIRVRPHCVVLGTGGV